MREWNWQPFDYVGISFENAVCAREGVPLLIPQLNGNFQGTSYYNVVSWSLIDTWTVSDSYLRIWSMRNWLFIYSDRKGNNLYLFSVLRQKLSECFLRIRCSQAREKYLAWNCLWCLPVGVKCFHRQCQGNKCVE